MLPGVEILEDKETTIQLIKSRRNPDGLPPLKLLGRARPVGREVFSSDFFVDDKFYFVLYEHPTNRQRDKVYSACGTDLRGFLQAKIVPERGEGLDITLAPQEDFGRFLICNHDGEMFLLPGMLNKSNQP